MYDTLYHIQFTLRSVFIDTSLTRFDIVFVVMFYSICRPLITVDSLIDGQTIIIVDRLSAAMDITAHSHTLARKLNVNRNATNLENWDSSFDFVCCLFFILDLI